MKQILYRGNFDPPTQPKLKIFEADSKVWRTDEDTLAILEQHKERGNERVLGWFFSIALALGRIVEHSQSEEYRGLNVLSLASQGYPSRFWLTFNQANKLGGRITKGQRGSLVVYWNIGEEREVRKPDGSSQEADSVPTALFHCLQSFADRGYRYPCQNAWRTSRQ
jgi:hypothetical protein